MKKNELLNLKVVERTRINAGVKKTRITKRKIQKTKNGSFKNSKTWMEFEDIEHAHSGLKRKVGQQKMKEK
jgi:hypothetical protein